VGLVCGAGKEMGQCTVANKNYMTYFVVFLGLLLKENIRLMEGVIHFPVSYAYLELVWYDGSISLRNVNTIVQDRKFSVW
jgi:hypothetical protein